MTKSNEQHQFDLFYIPLKEIHTSTYVFTFVLEAIYNKAGCLNAQRYINAIMGLSLKVNWQGCLKNTKLTFEGQQKNLSTLTQLLWEPLIRSWKNSCLRPWMLKSFKTLKKYLQTGLKIWIALQTRWTRQNNWCMIWSQRMQLN